MRPEFTEESEHPVADVVVYLLYKNLYRVDFQVASSNLQAWLSFAALLYLAGLRGRIFNYKNFLVTRRSIELRYLGIITSFVLYGRGCNDARGMIYGLLLLIRAACESAIGLGIIIAIYRAGRSISFSSYQELGG